MNKAALKELGGFNCTEQYWKFGGLFPNFVYSDGVKFLSENADCYWLLIEIAAAQMLPKIKNDSSLQSMQFWTLKKGQGSSATLICERDSDDVAYTKEIEFTDYPFDATGDMRIWVAPTSMGGGLVMVAYLPSEH